MFGQPSIFLLFFIFLAGPAFSEQFLNDDLIYSNIVNLNEFKGREKCTHGSISLLLKSVKKRQTNSKNKILDSKFFINYLKTLNLTSDCIWETIKKNAALVSKENSIQGLMRSHSMKIENRKIKGFSFGKTWGLSNIIGALGGIEFVFFKVNKFIAMVGLVSYVGVEGTLALPVGASYTQGVIYGNCKGLALDYLGYFETLSYLAMSDSYGVYNAFRNQKLTHCNSMSSTRGFTSPIIGISKTLYKPVSELILVRGKQVQKLLDYITHLNSN